MHQLNSLKMENQIIIDLKETGDETYPLTYTVKVTGNVSYRNAINILVALTDKLINQLQAIEKNGEKNLQLEESKTGETPS